LLKNWSGLEKIEDVNVSLFFNEKTERVNGKNAKIPRFFPSYCFGD